MVDAYRLVQRQWNVGFGGRTGFRWEGVRARLEVARYSADEIAEVAEGLDVIEGEVLAMDEERRQRERRD